ncbi:Sulfotransferase 4A1 [Halocaridina rubra]|uniref:Sulfotransferase 4A1 n=1 Tax=Halocaridina rubra TaxID=373956 RepID=A0AAN9ABE7_HALRR
MNVIMALLSGHEVNILEGEEEKDQKENWKGYTNGLVRLHPGRWLFPGSYTKFANKLYEFRFKSNDVIVMTWPKCGTTWMQEIVWTMRNSPDLNHPRLGSPINTRVPFIDTDMFLECSLLPPADPESSTAKHFQRLCPGKDPADGFFFQLTEAQPEPRTIKTHLPISLFAPSLLDTAKVIYVVRNPKDVLVSYYHHVQLFIAMSYVGTLDKFVEYFLNDDLVYSPFWLHIKEAWEQKDHSNLHFVFYEDMLRDIKNELKKLNKFLDTNLSDEQLEKVHHYTSFNEMKKRDNVFNEAHESNDFMNSNYLETNGGFYRKGKSGSWKTKLNEDQSQKVDEWIEKHLTPLGITFKEAEEMEINVTTS